jgi:hypothetical protein
VSPHPDLATCLDALADRIAERIVAVRERERYDSLNLPPHTTRRRFAEVCRSGRVDDARRAGRAWECSRVAWEEARTRRPNSSPPAPQRKALDAQADELLGRAGLRIVRGRP